MVVAPENIVLEPFILKKTGYFIKGKYNNIDKLSSNISKFNLYCGHESLLNKQKVVADEIINFKNKNRQTFKTIY